MHPRAVEDDVWSVSGCGMDGGRGRERGTKCEEWSTVEGQPTVLGG